MSMRLSKWILILVFVAGAFLGKPLALGVVGLFAKTYLFLDRGWQLSYGAIDWQEGRLIFKEAHIHEKKTGDLHARHIVLSLKERHVEIDHPVISFSQIPQWKRGGDWTISMKEGLFEGEHGLEATHFSYEKMWPHHLGRLHLEKGFSQIDIEAVEEGNEICVDADLK